MSFLIRATYNSATEQRATYNSSTEQCTDDETHDLQDGDDDDDDFFLGGVECAASSAHVSAPFVFLAQDGEYSPCHAQDFCLNRRVRDS